LISIPGQFLELCIGFIWIACILLGTGCGILLGRYTGTFLGWLIANSLDMSMRQGGRFGRQAGALLGGGAGIALGIYSALYLVTLITRQTPAH
jgi:hypothetical protein